jgi:magnesium transporter
MQVTGLCRSVDGWDEVDDVGKILELRRDPRRIVWAESDVSDATEDDVRQLASGFALDELAVEDALNARQRPKLEAYPGHLLVVVYELEEIEDQLEPRQVAAFIGQGFVIVLHHGASQLMREARSRLTAEEDETPTVDSLLHVLLDSTVDDYEAKSEELAEEVEELEQQALTAARATDSDDSDPAELPSQYRLYTVKQQVAMLRRFALPMSRAVERLAHTGSESPDESELQFRDVEDHLIRLAAQVRSIDDLAAGVLDLTRSIQADTLNDVQKKLSGWAAVFAVPALILGLYGTNIGLDPKWLGHWGVAFLIGLCVASGSAVYVFFKRRDWI